MADRVARRLRRAARRPAARESGARPEHARARAALPVGARPGARPRIVTTDGEFHTLRRQLGAAGGGRARRRARRGGAGDTLAERLAAAVDDRTAAVARLGRAVRDGALVPRPRRARRRAARRARRRAARRRLPRARTACRSRSRDLGLRGAWVVGGGYKYLQHGEGNCWLRLPPHAARLRPGDHRLVSRSSPRSPPRTGRRPVAYGAPASRFAGSTYDPTSHYRAVRVVRLLRRARPDPGAARGVLPPPGRAARRPRSTRSTSRRPC